MPPTPNFDNSPTQVKSRTSNFTIAEDKAICSAFINVSKDPIVGVNQSSEAYWDRVHKFLYSNTPVERQRPPQSIWKRWGTIQKDTARFVATKLNKTGKINPIEDAKKQYHALVGKPFAFMHCWESLRGQRKWLDLVGAKGKDADNNGEESAPDLVDLGFPEEDANDSRPIGRDSAKKRRSSELQSSSTASAYVEVLQKMTDHKGKQIVAEVEWATAFNDREDRKLTLEEKKREDGIMKMDLSALDPYQRRYFRREIKAILARTRADDDQQEMDDDFGA
ncbi:glutathione S-transferase T3-like [Panicum hallii]|nr:glutathione S-transferase T3-like [Panicum hallii]